jgi:hypothetical protein
MNRPTNAAWIRSLMLLCALGAGAAMTQFLPSPQDMAAIREPATTAPREASPNASPGITETDVNLRHLTMVGCIA